MADILYEIPQLAKQDCFNIVERHKSEFTYPLHKHKEYELNFVQNAKGVRRIVGDSVEEIGDYDLVLIAAEDLAHVWEQGKCESDDIREITVQFSPSLFPESLLEKNQFSSIARMFQKARHGLAFPLAAIMKVYDSLDRLVQQGDSFIQFLELLKIMYEISRYDARILSSSSFANAPRDNESRRIKKVKQYINDHPSDSLTLETLSGIAGMSPSAFSRFFHTRTGKTLTSYINDIRLGNAARALVDTSAGISAICYACGFNNLSYFNRTFKNRRGVTPKEFRALYRKKKIKI